MLQYNVFSSKGPYQQFHIQLKNNCFNFYDFGGYEDRNKSTIKLIIDGLKYNESEFIDKEFETVVNTSDQMYRGVLGFANDYDKYKTIPCFSFDGWKQVQIDGFENTVELIKKEAKTPYVNNKLFWAGSVGEHIPPRVIYKALSQQYPEKLLCNSIEFIRDNPERLTANNFVSLPEHCKHKYLIDIEGVGWSARLKYLCFTKRVLFINDRPYKEFWMDGLVDGENCIIVNRDLSNLIEKFDWIESNTDLYEKLSNNLYEFAEKTFTKENLNKHIVEVFKKLTK